MIARGHKILGQGREYALVVMVHAGNLAVHLGGRTYHLAAESFANRLQAETDTENRHLASTFLHKVDDNPGIGRYSGPGRNHDGFRFCRHDLAYGDLVIAMHDSLCTKIAQIVIEVPGE